MNDPEAPRDWNMAAAYQRGSRALMKHISVVPAPGMTRKGNDGSLRIAATSALRSLVHTSATLASS